MAICSFVILSAIFFFSVIADITVVQDQNSGYLLKSYTLASGILFPLICMIVVLHYSQPDPTHCKLNQFERKLFGCVGIWNVVSTLAFFLCIHNISFSEGFGAYTLFYLGVFNIPLMVLIVSAMIGCLSLPKFYNKALHNLQYYILGYRALIYFLGTDENQAYALFSWSRVNAMLAIFINIVACASFRWSMKDRPLTKYYHVIYLLTLQILVAISSPLIPFSFILNFLYLFIRTNPFASNYLYSLLSLANLLVLGVGGVITPLFHLLFDINRYVAFSEHMLKQAGKIIESVSFCQHLTQVFILGWIYYYVQENISTPAKIGAGLLFLVNLFCFIHQIYVLMKVSSYKVDLATFKRAQSIHVGIRGVALIVGAVLSLLVFFGLLYYENNFLIDYPLYSMFLLISAVHFIYSIIMIIFYGGLSQNKAKQYFLLILQREQEQKVIQEAEDRLKDELKPIAQRSEVQLQNEECAICLADLFDEEGKGEVSEIKKCGHLFHTQCIHQWLSREQCCPTDRKRI